MMNKGGGRTMKKFSITFTELKKYNPITRTVEIQSNSEFQAKVLWASTFDKIKIERGVPIPAEKYAKIDSIKEIETCTVE
jgi:hypothetical protein